MSAWVLYDGNCSFCVRLARLLEPTLRRHSFGVAPLPAGAERPNEMRVLTRTGAVLGGADGVVFIARQICWAWPLSAIAKLPGGMSLLRVVYRWVAAHRSCGRIHCGRDAERRDEERG